MTVIISLFFLTEKHKAFSKDLSFWLLIRKKKKQNESQQNKYHQEACRKQLQPCWESDSCTGSCCSLSSARAAPGWSPLSGHYRPDHWDTARAAEGIPKQERKSHCYSWRCSLCPECWEEIPARSICEHVHHCRPLSFHVAWHDLIPSLEKRRPWETCQASQCPSCSLLSNPTALQCAVCPLTVWCHWQLPLPASSHPSSSIFSCLSASPALTTPQLPTHKKHSQSHPSMICTFVVARINIPWQGSDQLELEQNHTSQRKVMLQTTQPLPVIGCK